MSTLTVLVAYAYMLGVTGVDGLVLSAPISLASVGLKHAYLPSGDVPTMFCGSVTLLLPTMDDRLFVCAFVIGTISMVAISVRATVII